MQNDVITFTKGETIQGYYMLKTVTLKTSNTNNRYYDLTIADKTGEVNGKIWDPEMVRDLELYDGMLVKLKGLVNEWQGQPQINVERIRRINAGDRVRVEDFVPSAPYAPEDMLDEVLEYVNAIKDQEIKQITHALLQENREKLLHYPAAMKNHHSIRSGLLYHISTMLKMAERVLQVYTYLNADLLYAGVILHDLAKMEEMNATELGIVTAYTTEGLAYSLFGMLKDVMMKNTVSKVAALILKPSLREFKNGMDYTEVGGAPLLGINGGVIKAHGSSNAAAMKNAIRQGMLYLENGVLERIQSAVTATVEDKL
jgi:3'-5' exoribonuclease